MALSFDATINDINFTRQLAQMQQRVNGLGEAVTRESAQIDRSFQRLGQLAAGYFSFQALQELPAQIFKVRGEFQQLEIAFSTMLRSKAKADELLTSLVKEAGQTPFSLKDLAGGAKQLLAYGSSAGQVLGELRTLGNVAAGVSVPIGDLIYLYGTLRSQGRAYAVDIRQFAGRGIPIYQALADVLKINVDQVNDFVSAGKVGFKEVETAFKNITTGSGLFAGLLDAQSKSLLGLKERLTDAFDVALNDIGRKNQDTFASVINTATEVVGHYQEIIDVLKVITLTYGSYKAALLLAGAAQLRNIPITAAQAIAQAQAANATGFLTLSQTRAAASTALLSRAQLLLNASILANPVVLLGTAIVALTAAYFTFREETIDVKSAQELLAGASKNASTSLKTQGAEVKSLVGVIQNQNIAESERLSAYNKLNGITPDVLRGLDFQSAKTANLTRNLNEYLGSLEKKIRLEAAQTGFKDAITQDIQAADALLKAQQKVRAADQANKRAQKNPVITTGPDARSGGVGASLDLAAAKRDLDAAALLKNQTAGIVKQIDKEINGIYGSGSKDALNARLQELEQTRALLTDKLSPGYKNVEENIKSVQEQIKSVNKAQTAGIAPVAKTVEYYDAEIKKLKEKQSQQATNQADYKKFQGEIDAFEKARQRITGRLTTEQKKAIKDADKVGPFGSITYYEAIARKADEIIGKTPESNTGKLAQQNAVKLDAERKAEEIRKRIAVRSFDEELTYKKEQYTLYQRFVDSYGQTSADGQFAKLKASGDSYKEYLDAQIKKLEQKKDASGKLGEKDTTNLGALLTERDDVSGIKSKMDRFTESLAKAKRESQSLTDYLLLLEERGKQIPASDYSADAIAKRLALEAEIKTANEERKQELAQFLVSVAGSEEQRLRITKYYADLRAEVEKSSGNLSPKLVQDRKDAIDKAEKAEIESVQRTTSEASDTYKALSKVIIEEGRKALEERLKRQKKLLEELKKTVGQESELYKAALKDVNDTENAINADDLNIFRQYASLAGQLGEQLGQMNGALGQAGGLLSGLASGADNLTAAFKRGATTTELIQAGIAGAISLVNILVSSASQRAKAEADYARDAISAQNQYNTLLNDQIGLRSKLSGNAFINDYAGTLSDGVDKLSDATKKYQESLKRLQDGRARTGQSNAIDLNAVGQGAASGAAIGAAIGTAVPIIGNLVGAAIGAGVGALVGLFGGKKSKDEFGALLGIYPSLIQKSKEGVDELNVELAKTLIANNQVDEATKGLLQSTIDWTDQIKAAREQIKSVISELAGSLGNELRDNLVNAFKEGTDSAQAFGTSVSKVLENLLSQLIFNAVFKDQFQTLTDELTASVNGGDQNWVDDFGRFFGKADELTKVFNQGLDSAAASAKTFGLDIFKKTQGSGPSPNSLQTAIKGVSEETASILAGQLNAMRIQQAETGGVIRQQLLHLSVIAVNSGFLRYLESIDKNIARLSDDPLRGQGGIPR